MSIHVFNLYPHLSNLAPLLFKSILNCGLTPFFELNSKRQVLSAGRQEADPQLRQAQAGASGI